MERMAVGPARTAAETEMVALLTTRIARNVEMMVRMHQRAGAG